ncbi:MAG: hypothetical protein KDC88_00790 [Ignavibacteriae bacterium]|nr:hypothetical protein [Ignavibacteriota bacterium]MCB9210437.1 hypothetical protein [Ignavibacteriales bacterium]MCB9219690.1 hypothetical protein [Ignavibacteriales bacterium]MCB9259824.1 hypothetical protein [Ignavibacteriales bacterium]
MIAVIADDLTGAAEIAGLGLQYGLKVTLELEEVRKTDADILIIATDTRSLSKEEAYQKINQITNELDDTYYEWIFKKTDSVFRGHILTELKAFMNSTKQDTILHVASNPQIGRKIIDGKYFIDGIPLNETGFAKDPEFPITTSNIIELIGKDESINIHRLQSNGIINGNGIYLGEAGSYGDLKIMAEKITTNILPSGAAGFFAALLEKKGFKKLDQIKSKFPTKNKKHLIVQGSAYSSNRISIETLKGINIKILYMPKDVFYNLPNSESSYKQWLNDIKEGFKNHDKVMISINEPVINDKNISHHLKNVLANIVSDILKSNTIDELIIDGGATAYAIIKKLNYKQFCPIMQLEQGVIRMSVEGNPNMHIILKPGSYPLPNFLFIN